MQKTWFITGASRGIGVHPEEARLADAQAELAAGSSFP
jgi:hypothetical protein